VGYRSVGGKGELRIVECITNYCKYLYYLSLRPGGITPLNPPRCLRKKASELYRVLGVCTPLYLFSAQPKGGESVSEAYLP
jgi:hypothetical protein